ncbi:MAG: hypothetical protein R3B84_20195 [Zavarzinella sp.]
MSDNFQDTYQNLIQKLGGLIKAEADKEFPLQQSLRHKMPEEPAWLSAFVDVRWFADAEGFSGKLRIILPNEKLHGIYTSRDMKNLFREIWKVRKEDPTACWYGLKVSVTYEGIVTTELNNDPNCIIDITFLQS